MGKYGKRNIAEEIARMSRKVTMDQDTPYITGTDITESENGVDSISERLFDKWEIIGNNYYPTGTQVTTETLTPGYYKVGFDNQAGSYFTTSKSIKTDGIIELPIKESEAIIEHVTDFWDEDIDTRYGEYNILHKTGVLMYGPPGCHNKGTEVVMYDGSLKKVEDVVVDDLLMGPDSLPRRVLELKRGVDEMVEVTPVKGDSFVVNKHHIFHLHPSGKKGAIKCPIDISFNNFVNKLSKPLQEKMKLKRSEGILFNKKDLPS